MFLNLLLSIFNVQESQYRVARQKTKKGKLNHGVYNRKEVVKKTAGKKTKDVFIKEHCTLRETTRQKPGTAYSERTQNRVREEAMHIYVESFTKTKVAITGEPIETLHVNTTELKHAGFEQYPTHKI